MRLARDSRDELVYVYNLGNGQNRLFPYADILHVRGQAVLDPLCGRSAVFYGAEAIALGLATESFGAKFFANDSRPGGLLSVDGKLSDEAASRLKVQWEAYAGGQNRWRVAVLKRRHLAGRRRPRQAQFRAGSFENRNSRPVGVPPT
jgi:phage portal protein BeeE